MVILNYADKIVYLYWGIFNNNVYIGGVLFEFSSHELLAGMGNKKVWGCKICINPAQAWLIPDVLN